MNKSVVIVGASGHGKVVADIVLKNKDNSCIDSKMDYGKVSQDKAG